MGLHEGPWGEPVDNENPGAFLDRLAADDAEALRALGRRRVFPRGATLFNEGERSDRVVLILKGETKVSYFTDDGREVVLAVRGTGDLLGELSAIDGQPLSATVSALDQVEALVVATEVFKAYLAERPKAALVLLEMVTHRLRDADRKRVEFSAFDSVGRVSHRLVELARRFGVEDDGGLRIDLPLSQEELAGWTGSSREAVSKALQHLRNRGWIETRRRSITVKDVSALERRAT